MGLFGFVLFCLCLCASCTWVSVFIFRFGMFLAIISKALGVILKIKNAYPKKSSKTSLGKTSEECLFAKSL